MFIGSLDSNWGLDSGALTPEDAFSIDSKIDDGVIDANGNFTGASTGNFRSQTSWSGGCSTPTNYDPNWFGHNSCVSGFALN